MVRLRVQKRNLRRPSGSGGLTPCGYCKEGLAKKPLENHLCSVGALKLIIYKREHMCGSGGFLVQDVFRSVLGVWGAVRLLGHLVLLQGSDDA